MTVSVQSSVALPDTLTDELLEDLVQFTMASEEAIDGWEINLSLVDLDEIIDLHRRFMGLEEPTDILTFPFDPDQGNGGDIAICVPVAAENATEHNVPLDRELAFLVVHGLLHLLDHDDRTDEMRGAMLGRQDQILDQWNRISR
ncbi:MAG: rRNA maturation RNase YbeY [Chloroflexota bacterium]|nr:rRNA maturation RNase YbeY [Chloroflexota bacterium]